MHYLRTRAGQDGNDDALFLLIRFRNKRGVIRSGASQFQTPLVVIIPKLRKFQKFDCPVVI